MPCRSNDYGAERKLLMDIDPRELKCPDVVVDDSSNYNKSAEWATVSPSRSLLDLKMDCTVWQ